MGSAQDIMQTFAGRDLHAQFPERDGWMWRDLPATKDGTILYQVTRGDHHWQQQAILAVSLEYRPSEESVNVLSAVPDGGRVQHFLLVPQGADVSRIPVKIQILTMSSFGFIGGKLTWLTRKKNAMRYPTEERAIA